MSLNAYGVHNLRHWLDSPAMNQEENTWRHITPTTIARLGTSRDQASVKAKRRVMSRGVQ